MKPPRTDPLAAGIDAGGLLASLVARARGGEALLQRRQPSRFEPPQPWAEAPSADGDAAPPKADTPAPAPPRPRATMATAALMRAAVADDRAVPQPQPGTARSEASPPAPRQWRETPPVDSSVVARHTVAAPQMEPASAPSQPGHQPGPGAPHLPIPGAPASVAQAPGALRPGDAPQQTQAVVEHPPPLAAGVPPVPRPPPAGAPAVPPRPAVPAQATAPLLRMAPPPTVRSPEPARIAMPKAAAAVAAVPVQVTIGRIEVRAVTAAPAPAEPRRKSAPRLSLEQYLHNRHGGQG